MPGRLTGSRDMAKLLHRCAFVVLVVDGDWLVVCSDAVDQFPRNVHRKASIFIPSTLFKACVEQVWLKWIQEQ